MTMLLPALQDAQRADVAALARLARILAPSGAGRRRPAPVPARPPWIIPAPFRPEIGRLSRARREAALKVTTVNQRGAIRLNDLPRNQGEALYGQGHVEEAIRQDAETLKAQREMPKRDGQQQAPLPPPKKKRGRPRKQASE